MAEHPVKNQEKFESKEYGTINQFKPQEHAKLQKCDKTNNNKVKSEKVTKVKNGNEQDYHRFVIDQEIAEADNEEEFENDPIHVNYGFRTLQGVDARAASPPWGFLLSVLFGGRGAFVHMRAHAQVQRGLCTSSARSCAGRCLGP